MARSVSVNGRRWPGRGKALAEWLDLGVDSFQELVDSHDSKPLDASVAFMDGVTVVADQARYAGAASWFALLTLTGCGELVRAFAALYRSTGERELSRGYLPLLRSIQEHVGRVVWLSEPGAVIWGPTETPIFEVEDAWQERRLRALLIYCEWMEDLVSHARPQWRTQT